MAVPSTFADLSTTPGSNSGLVSDSTAVNQIDNHLQSVYALIASIYANSGNGWASPYLATANPSYTGTLTGGTGVLNLGSGQFYKDASGNVGIGTASPSFALDIVSAASGIVRVRGGTGTNQGGAFFVRNAANTSTLAGFGDRARIFGGTPDALASIYTSSVALTFDVASAERLRIDASGNVGIGTASPTQRLHTAGALFVNGPATLGAATGPGLFALEDPAFREYIGDGTGYDRHWSRRIASVTTDLVTIKDTGNVGIATTAPTHKLHVAGSLRVDAATSNSAAAGLAAALPATPAGYVTINVGGTDYKLPYYDA